MPAQLAPDSESQAALYPLSVYPPRKRWTRGEIQSLESTGLWNGDGLELIEGELFTRMAKNRPHIIVLMLVTEWLSGVFGSRYVNPEAPIDVAPEDNPGSEPEPDLIVLPKPMTEYAVNPRPAEVCLLVEISATTLTFDLGPKARLYARAGIPDYWVFDVVGRRVIVHRDPRDGAYQSVEMYGDGAMISPLAAPDKILQITGAFPPL